MMGEDWATNVVYFAGVSTLPYAKKKAYQTAKMFGHKLGHWKPTDNPDVLENDCISCGALAVLAKTHNSYLFYGSAARGRCE